MFGPARRTWVLGGGGARGAAQVGVLQALFEAGVAAPVSIVGTSVGALNGSAIAAYPSLAGTHLLREVWLSRQAAAVFQAHPLGMILSGLRRDRLSALPQRNVKRLIERAESLIGVTTFEHLRLPLALVATDLNAGAPAVFRSGELAPALLASTAIPGLFPSVKIDDREYMDGGVVSNTPLTVAVEQGARSVLAVGLMAGGGDERAPRTFPELIARTLQLSLHHQMLSDFERLRRDARIVVLCPITAPTASWVMTKDHVEAIIESARRSTLSLLRRDGSRLFRRSGIHYLDLE